MKAIADHNINPWPDGAAFAKVSWRRQPDENGVTRSGKFEQVAFMIKNKEQYASTAGWGWAQWMGTDLKPFGKDARFAQDCVACHAPLRRNDYVFTAPIAPLADSLPVNPLQWRVITSGVDPHDSTMFTLFGKEGGSALALVTWRQQEDSRWFGARIPAQVLSVELLDRPSNVYRVFKGSPLKETTDLKSRDAGRAAYLVSMRAAVMP
jgi:hypothetical protein